MLGLIFSLVLLQTAGGQEQTLAETPAPAPAATAPAPASRPAACTDEVHSGFDLWVGEWDVYQNGSDTQVATSRIEKLSGGCTVREQWMPFRGSGGISLSAVNHNTGRWQQTWVGSDGKRVDFEGGAVDGAMVITGYWDDVGRPGQDALIRMTYSRMDNGAVRQHGEASTDHGLSWQTSFDFVYRPKEAGQR